MALYTAGLTAPNAHVEGKQWASGAQEIWGGFAQAALRAGLLVQRGTLWDQWNPIAILTAADVDAIVTLASGITAVVAGQTVQDVAGAPGGVLDGVIGPGRIFPPRAITYTFNANANWGLAALGFTQCYTHGLDANGHEKIEPWILPAGGNITQTTFRAWSQHIATYIGACDGAGGGATLEIGVSNDNVVFGKLDYGVALYDETTEPSATATVTFDANEPFNVMKQGIVAVTNETTAGVAAAKGDPVAVRMVLAGADVRGQFSPFTSPSGGNFARLSGAYWLETVAAGSVGLIRMGG